MPKHFEFVFAAYALWVISFALYFFYLWRRSARTREQLAQYKMPGGGQTPGS